MKGSGKRRNSWIRTRDLPDDRIDKVRGVELENNRKRVDEEKER